LTALKKLNIELLTSARAVSWEKKEVWTIHMMNGDQYQSKNLLISTGSDQRTWDFLKKSGHTLVDPVPSLFTFVIQDKALTGLQGISVPRVINNIRLPNIGGASGPILITHWGLSGPAILKLSAWGARELYRCGYTFDLEVNWTGQEKAQVLEILKTVCLKQPRKQVHNLSLFEIPSRLWKYLCVKAGVPEMMNGSEIGKSRIESLAGQLTCDVYRVIGKSTNKDEFVTAGGVALQEIDFTRFESKIIPTLFLVGEVLNIDALTGGFNFQAAWTGAEMVARAIASPTC
ncbi:MAG TPA: aminoacetone oxidase family FAD-binding enzyme, partial [Saprospiraceae bacterium]|nr:aminoacetone oxidase family FAD-binding enzyme [Saprospiraceae bacterium]